VAILLGVVHAALFQLLLSPTARTFPIALGIAVVGSLLGAAVGTVIPPAILAIGDANLIAATIGAWTGLSTARLFRFC
jgi:hypothetical protein